MNIAIVNVVGIEGSTGKIATKLAKKYSSEGHVCRVFHGRGQRIEDTLYVKRGNRLDTVVHYCLARLTGKEGYYSTVFTKRIIKDLAAFAPDRLIILNLHGHWLNIPLFFREIAKLDTRIEWFMCDEYPFTARCEYTSQCDKYKTQCQGCVRYKNIPAQYRDKANYYGKILRKTRFSSVEYIVRKAKESSLIGSGIFLINNTGVDTDFYRPVSGSSFRAKHSISDDQILLIDVAPFSNKRKGVQLFIDAAKLMADDKRFVFLNVGYDGKEQIDLPNLITIPYVSDQEELREIYSSADRYVCTSTDDALPNACVEAMSCGTPIIAFNISGMPYLADYPVLTLTNDISAAGIADAVKRAEKKKEESICACRKEAIEKYNFSSFADRILQ